MIGTTVSHYRITAKLGQGGMGEVYRAHDERLDRDVAIKVLPEEVAQDEARLARFEREAKLLASLSHQNIATLHGLEEHEGQTFLVMELAEGETLAERIKKGSIPIDDALPIALQIAEGLEAAHEQGIIHRDLKPANVMLSPEGKVKILDFGLAKAWAPDEGDADLTHSPTLTAQMTAAGVLLGTAAYMSPEQARGKPVDKRADIWAFGVVLWEMLTGQRLFTGDTVSDVLASVLKEAPDLDALPPDTPWRVRDLLRRCLVSDPKDRLRDIGDARIDLGDVHVGSPEMGAAVVQAPRRRSVIPIAAAVLAGVILGGLAVWGLLRPTPPAPPTVTRFTITLPEGRRLAGPFNPIALSRDGSTLAYVAESDGVRRLFIHELSELDARPLAGTERAAIPIFSPDGQWIAFFADSKLKRASVAGAGVIDLCDVPAYLGEAWAAGAHWFRDGRIIFPQGGGILRGLQQVSFEGGDAKPLTQPEADIWHYYPHILPDQTHVLFTIVGIQQAPQLALLSLVTNELRILLRGPWGWFQSAFLSSGHLVYSHASTLFAAKFTLARYDVASPVPVLDDVHAQWVHDHFESFLSLSDGGSLAYVAGTTMDQRELVWVDRGGRVAPVNGEYGPSGSPGLSPDGTRAAVEVRRPFGADIWILDLERGTRTRLTHQGYNHEPVWTPDGLRIVFYTGADLGWMRADGGDEVEQLGVPLDGVSASSCSPDGRVLAFYASGATTRRDIHGMNLYDDRTTFPILVTEFNEHSPMFSPDGRWLAYVSDRSGREEVYVQSYPEPEQRHQVSTEGGREAVWSRDGSELFYRSGDKMMAVDVVTGTDLAVGMPRMLFEAQYLMGVGGGQMYDVSPDGLRFLMIREPPDAAPNEIRVVLNWAEELERLVPVEQK
jgi:serine/threonine-protein kinase